MITPFDWQEGIGNRAQYIEGKLKHGSPVVAVSLESGILIYTRRRQSRKIFEVYDRLMFSAIGQQSDVEALRSAAVEFAHQEGYNRSEQDVTIQRVVTALSTPVKKAFADFNTAPLVARSLFAEVADELREDKYYILNYDGDYHTVSGGAVVTGSSSHHVDAENVVAEIDQSQTPEAAVALLANIWATIVKEDEDEDELKEELEAEAMFLERSSAREDRFRSIPTSNAKQ